MSRTFLSYFFTVIVLLSFQGCATISPFDQFAYAQVTAVKVDVLELMDKSIEPYQNHEKEIGELNNKLLKIVEYEKHRPKNGVTLKMWSKLFGVDSTGLPVATSIIPSYWAKWKKDGKENPILLNEAKGLVSEGFDLIAQLESQKIKTTSPQVSSFLSNK